MFEITWDLDPSKNVAQQIECDLVKHICNNDSCRLLLHEILEIDEPVIFASHVVQPIRRDRKRQPGDLDILICPVGSPEQAIAIECKRIPVFAKDYAKKNRYHLRDRGGRHQYRALEEGAEQIRKLYGLRFHRTYHLAIIATDGRERWGYNPFFRKATPHVHDSIAGLREPPHVPSGVGLITVEIAQTMDKLIQYGGSISVSRHRPARHRIQSKRMTDKVVRLLDNPLSYLEEARVQQTYEGPNDRPTLHFPLGLSTM